jgi:RND family efflux transporter MFP subunit
MKKEKQEESVEIIRKKGFLKKHKKGLIILGIVLAIIIGISSYIVAQVNNLTEALTSQYATTTLEKRNIINSVSVNGTIASEQSKDVSIPVTNVDVLELQVEIGDVVSEGDIIAILDSSDIEESLEEARQALLVAKSQTQSSINSASDGLDTTKESATINESRAQENIDGAYMDYASAGASEASALSAYNTALAETTTAKTAYDKAMAETSAAQDIYDAALLAEGVDMNTFESKLALVEAADAVTPYVYAWNSVGITTDLTAISIPADAEMDEVAELSDASILAWTEGSTDPSTAIAKKNAISAAITDLKNSQVSETDYNTALTNTSAQLAVLTTAETKETTAKATYEAKKAISDQKKLAYDSAKATREAKADIYNSAAQSLDDIERSNDTSISSQENSLDNTKLSATTATTLQENQVELYEEQLEACIVRAPFDGTITAINYEEGDTYSGMTLYTIQNTEAMMISASVDQYDISDIADGMRVVFKTDTTGDEEMIGVVSFVSPVPELSTGLTTSTNYPIEITVENPNDRLRLGMTAQANIVLEEVQNVFAVPYECIKTDIDGNTYINRIVEDAQVGEEESAEEEMQVETDDLNSLNQNTEKIYVTTGLETDYYTEITAEELEEGMIIQLSYLENSFLESVNGVTFGGAR